MKKLLVILALLVSTLTNGQSHDNRGYKVKTGQQSPNLTLKMLDGSYLKTSDLKGKIVVLQFTASWCSVCREEMPHLEKEVWQRFKEKDFLLIAVDLKEEKDKVEKFIKSTGITYPVALDSDGSLFESFTEKGAGVTRNIVLNRDGKIIFLSRLYERKEFELMIKKIEEEFKI